MDDKIKQIKEIMEARIAEIKSEMTADVENVDSSADLFRLKAKYILGKTGLIPSLMKELGNASKRTDRNSV